MEDREVERILNYSGRLHLSVYNVDSRRWVLTRTDSEDIHYSYGEACFFSAAIMMEDKIFLSGGMTGAILADGRFTPSRCCSTQRIIKLKFGPIVSTVQFETSRAAEACRGEPFQR